MYSNILNKIGNFSSEQVSIFEKRVQVRSVLKDEILLHEGEVCQTIFYVISGSFYQYNIKNEMA